MTRLELNDAKARKPRSTPKGWGLPEVDDVCRRHAHYRVTQTEIRHSRLGSPKYNLSEFFDNGKTVVSIGSKPTQHRVTNFSHNMLQDFTRIAASHAAMK
jgi:hypothetical protein